MTGLSKMRRARTLATVLGLIFIVAVVVTWGFSSPKPGPSAAKAHVVAGREWSEPVSDSSPSKVDYQRLDERIRGLMQDPDMVGLAVGAIEGGRVRFLRGYGETLAGSGRPVTPDTVFRWASLSKAVAAALVSGLAEEGKLSLDAPLAKMGTTLTLPGDASHVTVADVLSHRLGLVHNAWDDRLEAGADPKLLRAGLGTLPPYCAPATCYSYQNVAFDTASEIVERVTGQDYASVARARLFEPLGMTNASIGRAGLEGAASWARPHHHNKAPAIVNDSYYRVPAAGGVNSSIRDLILWMRAQMGDAPEVLSPAVIETMHHPRVTTPPRGRRGPMDRALTNAAYGLGWRSYVYAGHALVGHRGSVDGYGSLILFDPAEKSGIVMLWNSNQSKAGRLQLEFFDMLYGLPPTDWLELQPPSK
ncbi:MAG: serine hydrolase [Candidatus Sphingomonas colombiensis]|nr:serine hydrolase domain-containing protein [Sphingomonas sp.]WEK44454.1 MAG: serine hydrolase [Sphingomonas sp.]